MFTQDPLWTIYHVEQDVRKMENDKPVQWWHSFLALAPKDGDPKEANRVFSQIHFVPDTGYLTPKFYKEIPVEQRGACHLFDILSGGAGYISDVWNHMGMFADSLNETAILFGLNSRYEPTSINCRTGSRETCKSADLVLLPEFTKSAAGMEADSFFIGSRFNHSIPRP